MRFSIDLSNSELKSIKIKSFLFYLFRFVFFCREKFCSLIFHHKEYISWILIGSAKKEIFFLQKANFIQFQKILNTFWSSFVKTQKRLEWMEKEKNNKIRSSLAESELIILKDLFPKERILTKTHAKVLLKIFVFVKGKFVLGSNVHFNWKFFWKSFILNGNFQSKPL